MTSKENAGDLLQLESYHYDLPPDRIAQVPVTPRDSSRLLVVRKATGNFEDTAFRNLPDLLTRGDLLVFNNSKVFPARIMLEHGELLLVREVEKSYWDCLVFPGKQFKTGSVFTIENVQAEVLAQSKIGRLIRFHGNVEALWKKRGSIPLPPYIQREANEKDRSRYQTIYARKTGSVAAPTAGLHFSKRVFAGLKEKGIDVCKITLHVGPGTFRPVKSEDVRNHVMDAEYYSCPRPTWDKIQKAKRVIAVGTTTVRTLETIATTGELSGFTNLFIYPGAAFRIVRGMITNFHLPRSSLLMLVSAFGGYSLIRKAYAHAIQSNYRFYSYGDAMLIL